MEKGYEKYLNKKLKKILSTNDCRNIRILHTKNTSIYTFEFYLAEVNTIDVEFLSYEEALLVTTTALNMLIKIEEL